MSAFTPLFAPLWSALQKPITTQTQDPLGPELINADTGFDSSTGWSLFFDNTIAAGVLSNNDPQTENGARAPLVSALVVGANYRLTTTDMVINGDGTPVFELSATGGTPFTREYVIAAGSNTFDFQADAAYNICQIRESFDGGGGVFSTSYTLGAVSLKRVL
jgi:hypothetical protein